MTGGTFTHEDENGRARPAKSRRSHTRPAMGAGFPFSFFRYQHSAISYQLSAIGYQFSVISYQLLACGRLVAAAMKFLLAQP
jgi:hypothetical protein